MPMEGRTLGLRAALAAVSGAEIGDESGNSGKSRETAKGASCESEGEPSVSFLSAVRQAVSGGCTGPCLEAVPRQWRRCRGGRGGGRVDGDVWPGGGVGGAVAAP